MAALLAFGVQFEQIFHIENKSWGQILGLREALLNGAVNDTQ